MHLSRLTFNPRSRQARRDLAHPYELHRSLLQAFPGADQGGPGRILWRLETDRESGREGVSVLVQSHHRPCWEPLAARPGYLLCAPESKPLQLHIHPGQRLRFRLRANPTVKRDGKRLGLRQGEEQRAWLQRKADAGGFSIDGVRLVDEGLVRMRKGAGGTTMTLCAVRFDGLLVVTEANAFRDTLAAGIGSAKAFGFGLLSVAAPR